MIQKFHEFSINESHSITPEDKEVKMKFEGALINHFGAQSITNKPNTYYEYSKSHIYHQNSYKIKLMDAFKQSNVAILKDLCNIDFWNISAYCELTEVITPERGKAVAPYCSMGTESYSIEFDNNKSFDSQISKFLSNAQKSKLSEKEKESIISSLKYSSYKETPKETSHVGLGSQASIIEYYDTASVYKIKGLDKLLDISKDETEEEIKKNWKFKKSSLKFDWKNGVLYSNGSYSWKYD